MNSLGLQALKPKPILIHLMAYTLLILLVTVAGICQLAVSQAINSDVEGLLRVRDKNTIEAVKYIVELVFALLPFKKLYFNVGGGRSLTICGSLK